MSFERHSRHKIKHHPSEVDTDALWNSIKNDIPQEKKKKRIIFFFFFGLSTITSLGLVLLSFNYSPNSDAHSPLTNNHLEYTSFEMLAPLAHPIEKPQYYFQNEENRDKVNSAPLDNNPVSEHSFVVNKDVLPHLFFDAQPIVVDLKTSHINKKTDATHRVEKALANVVSINKFSENERLELLALKKGSVKMMDSKEERIDKIEDELLEKEDKSNDKKQQDKVRVSFGMTTALSVSKAQITAKSSDYYFYARKRQITENRQFTYTMAADLILGFQKNWEFRTGLSYTQIGETLTYWQDDNSQRNHSDVNPNDPSDYSGDGDVITNLAAEIPHTSSINSNNQLNPKIVKEKVTLKNQHHITSIPCVAGYNVGRKKVSLLIESGFYFNINTRSTGTIVSSDGFYLNLGEQNNTFKKNILLSTYLGLSANIKLGQNSNLRLGVHHQYTPFPITTKDNVLKQKYHLTGINIGMIRTF